MTLSKHGYPSVAQWVTDDLSDIIRIEYVDKEYVLYDINLPKTSTSQSKTSGKIELLTTYFLVVIKFLKLYLPIHSNTAHLFYCYEEVICSIVLLYIILFLIKTPSNVLYLY